MACRVSGGSGSVMSASPWTQRSGRSTPAVQARRRAQAPAARTTQPAAACPRLVCYTGHAPALDADPGNLGVGPDVKAVLSPAQGVGVHQLEGVEAAFAGVIEGAGDQFRRQVGLQAADLVLVEQLGGHARRLQSGPRAVP